MVHFKTGENGKGEHDRLKEVEKAIKIAICDKSAGGPTEGSIVEGGCVHRGISKVSYDIGEKGVGTGRDSPK